MEQTRRDIVKFTESFLLYEDLKEYTIVVTGANGLLGRTMIQCLLFLDKVYNLNLTIIAVVRDESKAKQIIGISNEHLSYYQYEFGLGNLFGKELPHADIIIHLAAPTASHFFVNSPVETMQIVVGGANEVLVYAKEHPSTRLLYVSSLEVYGMINDDSVPLTEDVQGYIDPMSVRSSYSLGKRAAECLCKSFYNEYNVHVVIARLAQTFGAGVTIEDNRVFAQFARSVIEGNDIVLHTKGELKRCYCYTTDAVSGMLYSLLRGKAGEAYNIANESTYISIADMAKMAQSIFNPNKTVKFELREGEGYSPTTKLRLSTEKIRNIGWKPQYELKEMFEMMIESMKNENYA